MAVAVLPPEPLADKTPAYLTAVASAAARAGVAQADLDAARAAGASTAPPSDFMAAASDVSRSIAALSAFIRATRTDYATPGAVSEAERDRIEAEAGSYVRSCARHVASLERAAAAASPPSTSATVSAHRHGVALILAERLAGVSGVFDRARAARYGAAAAARAAGEAALRGAVAAARARADTTAPSPSRSRRSGSAVASATADAAALIAEANATAPAVAPPPRPQLTQALATESAALVAELVALGTDAARAEATAREVAALSQAFSAQVASQAAVIEGLYADAVSAVENVGRGNVQLAKANAAGVGSRRLTFYALVAAALAILLADWLSS